MNLGEVLLGIATIALGATTMKKGFERVHNATMGSRTTVGRIAAMPPVISQGKHVQTRSGPMRTTLHSVGSLDERLAAIAKKANEGKTDPRVIAWARKELSKKCRAGWNGEQWCVPEKDTLAEIDAIYKALRRDIRYTSDVHGIDTYAHPKRTLELGGGDCDEYSATACAALMAVGIPCRFKVIRTKDSPTWNHIYVEAGTSKQNPTKWIALDASVAAKPGWEAPKSMVAETKIYPAY